MAGTEARDPATLRLDSIVRQRDWIENGEINCTSIVGSSLEPRTCIHTYKFFHVRAAARSHFSWDPPPLSFPTLDSSLLFLVDASDLYNHDSSVNLSLLSIDAPFPRHFFQWCPLFFWQLSLSESGSIVFLLFAILITRFKYCYYTFQLFLNIGVKLLRDEQMIDIFSFRKF